MEHKIKMLRKGTVGVIGGHLIMNRSWERLFNLEQRGMERLVGTPATSPFIVGCIERINIPELCSDLVFRPL